MEKEQQKEEEIISENQLSSDFHQSIYGYYQNNNYDYFNYDEEKERDYQEFFYDLGLFMVKFVISFIQFSAAYIGIIIFIVFASLETIKCNLKTFQIFFPILISLTSTYYSLIKYLFLNIENQYVYKLYEDGIFFFVSSLFVFSYIKAFNQINIGQDILNCAFSMISVDNTECYFRQDFSFTNENKTPFNIRMFRFDQIFEKESIIEQIDVRVVNLSQFVLLVLMIFLKLTGIFYYIYRHSLQIQTNDFLDMTVIIFVYIYTCYNLLRTFGSYDLKRKVKQMSYFKYLIDFGDTESEDFRIEKKLDITDPKSLEGFDHQRKIMLNLQKSYLEKLDYAYVGIGFYYLFVIIICCSYYFELEWLIEKNSSLLAPISVIMSTGNFIFLSTFFMLRLSHGTQFNNTFDELELTVDHLLDLTDDLITMYDHLFCQSIHEGNEKDNKYNLKLTIDRFSAFGLLVKKIKCLSKDMIRDNIKYQGQIYQMHEKHILRKQILLNMKQTLEKVKKSVQADYKLHKYFFMGFIDVDFNSFLFTLLIGVVTSLPSIIPKFIHFYSQS